MAMLHAPAAAQTRVVDGRIVKPARTVIQGWHESETIAVKFRDGLSIEVRAGGLVDDGSGILAPAFPTLAGPAAGEWERTHRVAPERLRRLCQTARERGTVVPDLTLDMRLHLAPGLDAATAIDALNALDIVELAWPVAKPVPPPSAPDFTALQTYTGVAPGGMGVRASWPRPAATGRRVKVCDVEYEFDNAHRELTPAPGLVNPWVASGYGPDHGTAVLGELFAHSDGKGTTGMVPLAEAWFSPPITLSHGYNAAAAITDCLVPPAALDRGDVILIEQQTAGPNFAPPPCCSVPGSCPPGTDCQLGLVPSEWDPSVRGAIQLAVGLGVHVVEAAGNGSQNLDDPVYGGWFATSFDSGAILVGAGASPAGSTVDRSRLSFSNYGSTVDLQGQGENVATTGYGDLFGGSGSPEAYTAIFSGTSSASPMVAAACAIVSSTFEEQTRWPMAPRELRDLLRQTGSAQASGINPSSQNIGPRPNIVAALTQLELWRVGDDDPLSFLLPGPSYLDRRDATFVYDSSRGTTVIVTAEDMSGQPMTGPIPAWDVLFDPILQSYYTVPRPPSFGAAPPHYTDAAAAYDAKRDRIVMFGGSMFGIRNSETWEFDPDPLVWSWTLVATSGPAARFGHSMAYDPVRERVVLVGGDCGGSCGALTWEWNGTSWQAFSGPPERTRASLVWDSDRSRMVLFGGFSPQTLFDLGDTWERSGTTWTQVASSGPSARSKAAIAYDTSRRRVVLDGGFQTPGSMELDDTWEWDGLSWRQSTAPAPFQNRSGHALVYDTAQGRLIGFGGERTPAGPGLNLFIERDRRYQLGAPYCFGDGTGLACPCGNVTDRFVKSGCANSQGTGGRLRAVGQASLFQMGQPPMLQGSEMPNGPALYFQGTTKQSGGLGIAFGDGHLCVGGTITRLGVKFNVLGASSFPEISDPPLVILGGITDTGTRTYQAWYRDAAPFCTSGTYNLTNAIQVVWGL